MRLTQSWYGCEDVKNAIHELTVCVSKLLNFLDLFWGRVFYSTFLFFEERGLVPAGSVLSVSSTWVAGPEHLYRLVLLFPFIHREQDQKWSNMDTLASIEDVNITDGGLTPVPHAGLDYLDFNKDPIVVNFYTGTLKYLTSICTYLVSLLWFNIIFCLERDVRSEHPKKISDIKWNTCESNIHCLDVILGTVRLSVLSGAVPGEQWLTNAGTKWRSLCQLCPCALQLSPVRPRFAASSSKTFTVSGLPQVMFSANPTSCKLGNQKWGSLEVS